MAGSADPVSDCRQRSRAPGGALTSPARIVAAPGRVRTDGLLARILVTLFAFALFLAVVSFHFKRHFVAGMLDPAGMNIVQSARLLSRSHHLSTNVIRPLLTSRLSVNHDGNAPDFLHAPLYPILVACVLHLTHQTHAGQGDRDAILVSLFLYILASGATLLLARRFFGARPFGVSAGRIGFLFFALSSAAPALCLQAHPAMLSALLFSLLLCALYGLDTHAAVNETPHPISYYLATLSGILWGLLFLTLYSALLILPPILVYLYMVCGRGRERWATIFLFLTVALMVMAPLLARNQRLAHNPFYSAHLIDLVLYTKSFPGDGLLSLATPPRTLSQYLANGGIAEVMGKAAHNVGGFVEAAPNILGFFLLPLFLLSALIRFTDMRVNRMRNLVFACIGCHLLGLAFFEPWRANAPLLLMYAPWASVIGAGFLLSLVHARNLPEFYRRAAIGGWTVLACLPGIALIAAPSPAIDPAVPYGVYASLQTSPDLVTLQTNGAYLAADEPAEAAFYLDVPIVDLPVDSDDMRAIAQRTGRPIGGVLLTPAFSQVDRTVDPYLSSWQTLYRQVIALTIVTEQLKNTNARLEQSVIQNRGLFYPSQLAGGMRDFRPAPFAERAEGSYSLLFWNDTAASAVPPAE